MSSLKKIVWSYLDKYSVGKDWRWRSIISQKSPYYLFVSNNTALITLYSNDQIYPYNGIEFPKLMGFNCLITTQSEEIFRIFGDDNLEFCKQILIEWIEENIPLDPMRIKNIGERE